MTKSTYIAIDMGAGSIRVMLGTVSDKIELEEIHRFDNSPIELDGHLRWSLSHIEGQVVIGVKKAIEKSTIPVSSVSADSWGVDFVVLGKDGKYIEFPVTYRDDRTVGMPEKWKGFMSKEETFQRTGINYYPFNSLFQFLAIKDSELLKNAKTILFTSSYVNYFLSGKAINELSLSSTTQLLNVKEKTWDKKILGHLGISPDIFGSPVQSGKVIGKLKSEITSKDINVALAPGHDSACAVVALPVEDENFAFLSTGTWCVLGMESERAFTSELALNNGITNEMTADGKFRPLINIMGLWLVQQLRQSFKPKMSYSEIEKLCEESPSPGYLVDADDASFYNPEDMVKAFDRYLQKEFDVQFTKPAQYYRCAYESLAASFAKKIKILEELRGKSFSCIHITGGGCLSKILCQLTANATGLKAIAEPVEGAAMGNVLVQAIADGKIADLKKAREIVRKSIKVSMYNPF